MELDFKSKMTRFYYMKCKKDTDTSEEEQYEYEYE